MTPPREPTELLKILFGVTRAIRGKEPFPEFPVRIKVSRRKLAETPYLSWNAMLELFTYYEYEELTDVQRPALLAYRYYSEVYNGGHQQFFLNSAGEYAEETVEALPKIGATKHAGVFRRAFEVYKSQPATHDRSKPFREREQPGLFEKFDDEFNACEPPDMPALLQTYLDKHYSDFIESTD